MYVIITTNTLHYGGAERQRVTLANGLARVGYSVQIRVLQQTGPLESELSPQVTVYKVRGLSDTRGIPGGQTTVISGTTKTEVAHSALLRYQRTAKTRWLVASHNPVSEGIRTYPRLVRLLVRLADTQICLSYSQAFSLVDTDNFSWKKIQIIDNGIDTGALDEIRDQRHGTGQNRTARILFIGRLVEQKGLDLLLLSLRPLKMLDWSLDVVGAGPMESLRASPVSDEMRDRITWWGARDPAELLRQCDILVVPSRNEAYPLVVIEALVAGVPLVATDVGSVPEILMGASAISVESQNIEQMTDAIDRAIQDLPAMRLKALAQGARYSSRFSASTMVNRYSEAIEARNRVQSILQVGPSIQLAGGISKVIADYLQVGFDHGSRFIPISSYNGPGIAEGLRSLLRSSTRLLSSRLISGRGIVHVHLSQGGSFFREGLLLRFSNAIGLYTVATIHGSRFDEFFAKSPRVVYQALKTTKQILVLTPNAQNAMQNIGFGDRTHEVFNAVEVAHPPLTRDWSEPVVVFAGEVGTRKGIDVLLAAWDIVYINNPRARLRIAGPLRDGWTQQVLDDKPGVEYEGTLKHSELLKLVRSATLAVLPSRAEAMPKFVLEALAAGVPVVASSVGALPRVVTSDVGILVDPGDVHSLADALGHMLVNPHESSRMGQAAYTRAIENFSNDNHFKTLQRIYSTARKDPTTKSKKVKRNPEQIGREH